MNWKKILWWFSLTMTVLFFIAFGWKMGSPAYYLHTPETIVPAAIQLPKDRRLLHDEQESELFGTLLQALQRRIDSLAADSAGRRIYDSIVEMRPGLLDSLKIVTRYFLH
jgi:hypothetical protein